MQLKKLEEDKLATTNVQNGLAFLFLFSYKKAFILREKSWRKNSEKVWKKCEKVPKQFCPLVVAL